MRNKPLILACLVALLLTAGDSGQAAIDTYFQMDGIPSDGNQAIGHTNETLVNSFSWSVATNAPGQPVFTFALQKYVAMNSPALAANCAGGITSATATLSCYKSAGGAFAFPTNAFYSLTLTNVQVTSVSVTNDPDANHLDETITLQFSAIQWTYVPQKPDGSYGTPIVTSFIAP